MRDFAPEDEDIAAEAEEILGAGQVGISEFAHGQRIGVTAGVARIRAGDRSAVVKVISPGGGPRVWRGSHDPASYRYWRREADVYEAGLPHGYTAAGVEQPELLGLFERADGRLSMWLRDVDGLSGEHWSVGRTGQHAARLGHAQGRCAVDDSWTEGGVPWSRGMLREYLDTPEATSADIDWNLLHESRLWETPLMHRHFGGPLRDEVLRLCDERYAFVELGERLPQTLCHHDAWPRNFLDDDGEHTIGVDWAFAGHGWIGADIGNYVSDTALDLLRPSEELPALDRVVFDEFCAGLEKGGWHGDRRAVRLGMCLMAAKWSWLVPVMLKRAAEDFEHTVYGSQRVEADRLYAERSQVFRMLVAWAAEARELASKLFGSRGSLSA
ncbi:phosphotransferase [Streptomyces albus]|uniref:phosphotransferase n=1 Tax=Streptomyces albus TaxID=1888 RepID=UPI0033E0363A